MKFMRAGSGKLVQNLPGVQSAPDSITVSSEEFAYGDPMPARFSHMGGNLSPALSWAGVPPEAAEIVLIVEDPDAPMPNPFVHAIAYGLDPSVKCLSEGILLGRHLGQASPHCLKIGKNTFGNTGYYGPAPIPEHGKHHYYFQVFALDKILSFKRPPSLKTLLKQMEDHVIARGTLVGTFERT
jgi:Raf kinase inhibitor-like YbhB/YbcL family protein